MVLAQSVPIDTLTLPTLPIAHNSSPNHNTKPMRPMLSMLVKVMVLVLSRQNLIVMPRLVMVLVKILGSLVVLISLCRLVSLSLVPLLLVSLPLTQNCNPRQTGRAFGIQKTSLFHFL